MWANRTTNAFSSLLYMDDLKNRDTSVLLKEELEVVIDTCSLKSKVLVRNKINDKAHTHTKKVRNQPGYINAFAE